MTASRGLSPSRLARLRPALATAVERGEVPGLVALVARGDTLHVETIGVRDLASGAPMRRDTIFRIASMTKPISAAAALMLVEEGRIGLDDSVEPWLPELADRRVLASLESRLDDTVPAARAITLRDLLTLRLGLGILMAPPGTYPIQTAMADAGVAPGPDLLPFTPDDFMARLGRLPLFHQPGEKWLYHTGADVLTVLIARLAGMPFGAFLQERVFAPVGMRDTGFSVLPGAIGRLATSYRRDTGGVLRVYDPAAGGQYAAPPPLPTELVSTADDYLAFARLLLRRGQHESGRLLARPTVALMMSDHITPGQKAISPFFPGFWDANGWGFGGSVVTTQSSLGPSRGAYGWSGGFGTTFVVDPAEDMIVLLMTQRLMNGPDDMRLARQILTLAYAAIDD